MKDNVHDSHQICIKIHLGSCTWPLCICGTLAGTSYYVRRFKPVILTCCVTNGVYHALRTYPQHDSIRKSPKRLNIATIYTKYTLKLTYVTLNWRQSVAYEILSRLYVHPSLDRHNGLFLLMTEQGDGWQISYLWWLFIISTGFYSLSGVIYCTEQRKITPRNYGELKLFIARFWSHNCLCQRGSNTSYCKTFLRTILRK